METASDHHVPYAAVVEEALCFGWIDSLPRKLDASRSKLLIAPRKPSSGWSAANRDRVARLERAGLMRAAGRAKVAAARADGSWDRLKRAETGEAPADLMEALDAADATAGWHGFTLAARKRMIEHLDTAKRAETRAARVAMIVAGARAGRDPLNWRRKPDGGE